MNENAKALYEDLLAGRVENFGMHDWCGSCQCIGGTAEVRMIESGHDPDPVRYGFREIEVAEWLGLDTKIADDLFYPGGLDEDENHPWAFGRFLNYEEDSNSLDNVNSPYTGTQPEAAEALRRACEMSAALQQQNG